MRRRSRSEAYEGDPWLAATGCTQSQAGGGASDRGRPGKVGATRVEAAREGRERREKDRGRRARRNKRSVREVRGRRASEIRGWNKRAQEHKRNASCSLSTRTLKIWPTESRIHSPSTPGCILGLHVLVSNWAISSPLESKRNLSSVLTRSLLIPRRSPPKACPVPSRPPHTSRLFAGRRRVGRVPFCWRGFLSSRSHLVPEE
jgi:hypothetical protein